MEPRERVMEAAERWLAGRPTWLVRSPGRVNLIGEHTDYNEGFVLPMAIDRAIWIALRRRTDEWVRAVALDFGGEACAFPLSRLEKGGPAWSEYLKGVAWALQQAGFPLQGWEGVIAGDLPIGAGLSSSAALEMAVARAFAAVSGWGWDVKTMALLGRRAENEWVGVQCGIMDQMICAGGAAGQAMLLDCRTLEFTHVPLPAGCAVVVLDTGTRRGLVSSAYNQRRAQCQMAADALGVPALRDAGFEALEAAAGRLGAEVYRRARHVIGENARTLQAAEAMRRGDAQELGRLMNASHISLRDDFEVSGPALDAVVECAWEHPACLGARMTGAGFAGCAIALIDEGRAQEFVEQVADCFRRRTGMEPLAYVCRASDGASAWTFQGKGPSGA